MDREQACVSLSALRFPPHDAEPGKPVFFAGVAAPSVARIRDLSCAGQDHPRLQGLREKVRHVYHVGGGPLPWRPCFLLM